MGEQEFKNYENIEAARAAIDLFEGLGCKFACVTKTQGGDVSVVFMPNIDGADNSTIDFYYSLDLNRNTITEKLAEAIGGGADYSKPIPGVNYIPKEVLENTRKFNF